MANRGERFINNLDFQFLTKTIELDLSHIYGKGLYPSQRDINHFITDDLKITAAMLTGVQNHPRFPKVFLQFEREEDVAVVEIKLKEGMMMSSKNIKIYGYRCDRPMVTIVLNGQDMSIDSDEITRVLNKYGTVVSCEKGKNNDLSTDQKFVSDGTWIVRLTPKLRTKPPETIYYFGLGGQVQTWICNFDGMGSSCVLCGRQGHKGFRCNALVPRGGGMGRQPAGFGKWTDVVNCMPVVDQAPAPDGQAPPPDDQAQQHDGQVQQKDVQQPANNDQSASTPGTGQSSSQPATGGNRGVGHARGAASQGHQVVLNRAEWGNIIPAPPTRVAGNVPHIPGLPGNSKEWNTVEKKKKKNKQKSKSKKKDTVATQSVPLKNKFAAISGGDQTSGDEDWIESDIESEQPKGKLPVVVVKRGNSFSSYGSRRNYSVVDFIKEGREKMYNMNEKKKDSKKEDKKENKKDKKRHNSNVSEAEEFRKKLKTMLDQAPQSETVSDEAQDTDAKLVETDKSELVTANDNVGEVSLVKDGVKHMDVEDEQLEGDGAASNLEPESIASISLLSILPGANQASHPLADAEDEEIKKKAAKIKEQLAVQTSENEEQLAVQTSEIADLLK